jgi:hypothetical protein
MYVSQNRLDKSMKTSKLRRTVMRRHPPLYKSAEKAMKAFPRLASARFIGI